jgi:hypothetical protein
MGKGYFDEEPESHDVDPSETPQTPPEPSEPTDPLDSTSETDEPSQGDSEPPAGSDPRLELVELFQRLILSDVHQAKSIYILGKRGYGKTFDTNELAKLFMEHGWRVHAVCPVSGAISADVQYSPINSPGGSMLDAAYIGALDDVMEGQRVLIVVDEVDQFCSAYKMEDVLKDVINYGRHLHIWFLCNARRPARVNRDITSLMDAVVVHYISSGAEERYIEDITDDKFLAEVIEAFDDFDEKCQADPSYKYRRLVYTG